MRFGRVVGSLLPTTDGLWLIVTLETAGGVDVVRDERVPALLAEMSNDPAWLVDQLVQEAIGRDLAEAGWEVIGMDSRQPENPLDNMVSPAYAVRLL